MPNPDWLDRLRAICASTVVQHGHEVQIPPPRVIFAKADGRHRLINPRLLARVLPFTPEAKCG
jgi:hypothetical protein